MYQRHYYLILRFKGTIKTIFGEKFVVMIDDVTYRRDYFVSEARNQIKKCVAIPHSHVRYQQF